jgi:hypothetical protein
MTGTGLAEAMLPRFRAGPEVERWDAADAHGAAMQAAVDELRARLPGADPAELLDVVQRAIRASIAVRSRADDSSGVIGDALVDLLDLQAEAAREAQPPPAKLVRWLIAFQFDGSQDFVQIDPVAYAPALGERGIALYRSKLAEIAAALPPARPADAPPRFALRESDPDAYAGEVKASHDRFQLEHTARRLAVLDRDVDAIIATHLRTGTAMWLEETAKALEEIGRPDLAIEWADRATHLDLGPQSQRASEYWCALIGEHRPEALPAARLEVLRRWPTATRATKLVAASDDWPALEPEVLRTLRAVPPEAVLFALSTDPRAALDLSDELGVRDRAVTEQLAAALEPIDVAQALPLHRDLVEADLLQTESRRYRPAAQRLARMRELAAGTALANPVDAFIAELRGRYPRRSRMLAEFDRARLP